MIVVWVLLALAATALLGGIALAFARLGFDADLTYDNGTLRWQVCLHWIHWTVIRAIARSSETSPQIRLLWWRIPTHDSFTEEPQAEPQTVRPPTRTAPDTPANTPPAASAVEPPVNSAPAATGAVPDKATEDIDEDSHGGSTVWYLLRQRRWRDAMLSALWGSIRQVPRTVSVRLLHVHVQAGGDDPAALGMAAGVVRATSEALGIGHRLQLTFAPSFDKPCLVVDTHLQLRTSAAQLTWPALRLLLTLPYLSTWYYYRRKRKLAAQPAES
jgi:hypothetical protein